MKFSQSDNFNNDNISNNNFIFARSYKKRESGAIQKKERIKLEHSTSKNKIKL